MPTTKKSSSKVSAPVSSKKSAFPDIMTGLRAAWKMLPKVALPYLGLTLLFYVGIIAVTLVIALLFFAGNVGRLGELAQAATMSPETLPALLGSSIVAGLVGLVLLTVWGSVFSVMQLRLLASAYDGEAFEFATEFKQSFRFVIPLFVTGLITAFFVVGGIGLIGIPTLIFAVLFSFVSYVVILDGKSGMAAIKESVRLVSGAFWPLFIRFLLIMAVAVVSRIALTDLFKSSWIIMSILNWVVVLFLTAYGMVLYRHAQAATRGTSVTNPSWMVVVAVIGWMVMIGGGALLVGGLKNNPQLLKSLTKGSESMKSWEKMEKVGPGHETFLPDSMKGTPEYDKLQRDLQQVLQDDLKAAQQEKSR